MWANSVNAATDATASGMTTPPTKAKTIRKVPPPENHHLQQQIQIGDLDPPMSPQCRALLDALAFESPPVIPPPPRPSSRRQLDSISGDLSNRSIRSNSSRGSTNSSNDNKENHQKGKKKKQQQQIKVKRNPSNATVSTADTCSSSVDAAPTKSTSSSSLSSYNINNQETVSPGNGSVEVIFYDAYEDVDDMVRNMGGCGDGYPQYNSEDPDCVWLDMKQFNQPPTTPDLSRISSLSTSTTMRGGAGLSSPSDLKVMDPPAPPKALPLRFLRAGKNDPEEGMRRYEATLQWRKDHRIDTILREPQHKFNIIKENYKTYFHLRGYKNEPVFYELPTQTNLKVLKQNGISIEKLIRFYTSMQEFLWQVIEPDDMARSIYVLDMKGLGLYDFAGEVVDFVKKASGFTGQHYPERAGVVFIVNVPGYFKFIWNVVKGWIDPVTLEKIFILRGAEETLQHLKEKIPIENIPPQYGGTSMPLGASPEEQQWAEWIQQNNEMDMKRQAESSPSSSSSGNIPPEFCPHRTWRPKRAY